MLTPVEAERGLNPSFHSSWPADARRLLLRAIDRHGGWSLWSRLESVSLALVSLHGLLPWVKGYGRTFQLPNALTTYPRRGRTEWRAQPGTQVEAVFDRGDVRVLSPAARESRAHRANFRGWRKLRRWDDVDALYFFGYAFASYFGLPFTLPALPFLGAGRARWQGQALAGVRVAYPAAPEVHVHSRVQSFYFDESGLLRRNDYVADVVGPFARGAHGWDDFVEVKGLPVPTRRTVVFRLGQRLPPFPTVLAATFRDVQVALAV